VCGADVSLHALQQRYAQGESPMDLAPKIHEICLQMSETFLAVIELQTLMDSASLAATIKEADRYAIVLPLPAFPCTTTVNLLAAVFASW
jgi:hypothetical protein